MVRSMLGIHKTNASLGVGKYSYAMYKNCQFCHVYNNEAHLPIDSSFHHTTYKKGNLFKVSFYFKPLIQSSHSIQLRSLFKSIFSLMNHTVFFILVKLSNKNLHKNAEVIIFQIFWINYSICGRCWLDSFASWSPSIYCTDALQCTAV